LQATIAADIALRKQSDEWTKAAGQFVPFPATYLRQARWTDDAPTGPPPRRNLEAEFGAEAEEHAAWMREQKARKAATA
jgi:hypothetical protein